MRAIRAARTLRIPGSASSGTAVASPSAPSSSCADVKFPVDANLDLKPSLWPAALLNTSVVGRCSASVGGFAAWNWYWFMSRCRARVAAAARRSRTGEERKEPYGWTRRKTVTKREQPLPTFISTRPKGVRRELRARLRRKTRGVGQRRGGTRSSSSTPSARRLPAASRSSSAACSAATPQPPRPRHRSAARR